MNSIIFLPEYRKCDDLLTTGNQSRNIRDAKMRTTGKWKSHLGKENQILNNLSVTLFSYLDTSKKKRGWIFQE